MTSKLAVIVLAAGVALPALAGAQRSPHPLYEPAMEDVGDWDAAVVVRLSDGRRQALRGREVNAVGCGGRCIESKVSGALDVHGYGWATPRGWNQDRFGDLLRTRTTLERPAADRRILSIYGRTSKDTDTLLLYVTYTRRR